MQPQVNESNSERRHGRHLFRRGAIFSVGLIVAGFLAFQLIQRVSRLEQRTIHLEDQLERTLKKVEAATESSQAALARALQAEENAHLAALGRIQADKAKDEAAQEAEQARGEASLAAQQAQLARQEVERIRQQREAEIERLQKALSKIADTQRTALGLVMTLGNESIQFDFDKAALRAENRELLSRIAGILLTAPGFRIQVFGHTDDIGSEEYNQGLSERRAQAVRDYLVEAGVDPQLFTIKGFGKSSPRVHGTTPEIRAKNRRVEIGIIDSIIGYKGQVAQNSP